MKILHVSGAGSWGGNEQQLVTIVPEMNKLNVKNIVFCVKDSVLHKKCEELNIETIATKNNKLNKFENYRYLKQLVKTVKPDLIHLHTSDSLTVFTISDLLFSLKVKAVFSKKGMGSASSILSKFKYNYKNIAALACVSERVKRDFAKILTPVNQAKEVVVHDCVAFSILNEPPLPINLKEQYGLAGKYIVGNIANHTMAKDLFTLVEVANHIVNTLGRKDVAFVQIGEHKKLTPDILALVKERNLDQYFTFTGKMSNAYNLNLQFDCFLMTSEREGGPTSVLEAMLMRTPVVSTNVGIVPEVIANGVNGFISDVKDHESLAVNVLTVLDNKELQDTFTDISYNTIAQNYTSEMIAKRTVALYQQILK